MKRMAQDYAGRPMPLKRRSDVLGRSITPVIADVASFLDAGGADDDTDAQTSNEFAEFMSTPMGGDISIQALTDPVFKERLRRRLWRLHLISQPTSRTDPH